MRPRPRRMIAAWAALLLIELAPLSAWAVSPPIDVENVRVGFDEKYKIGAWTPVWIQVRCGIESFEGNMEVVVGDDEGTPSVSRQPLSIPGKESRRVVVYVRFGSSFSDLQLRFIDKFNRRRGFFTLDRLRPNNLPTGLAPDEIQVLSLGKPQGVELLPSLPGFSRTRGLPGITIARLGAFDTGQLPGRAYGYDGVDAVVLDTNDKETMRNLSVQGEALARWVASGGHLIIAVGSNWQEFKDSRLAEVLPARIGGTTQVSDLRSLESFTGATTQIVPDNAPTTITKLDGADALGGKVLVSSGPFPLVVRGPHGFGRVTLIGFDVDGKPFSDWQDRNLFWQRAVDITRPSWNVNASGAAAGARFMTTSVSDLSTILRQALDQFSGIRLVPFAWVAFFVFLYVILVGPGDYFLLKKLFRGRMELTWITFPLIVTIVSGTAYVAAYRVKGTELRINKIDVLDVDQPSKLARCTTFFNIFSPENRDYSIQLRPQVVGPNTLNENLPTLPGSETRLGWFGVPESGLRGMSGGNRGIAFAPSEYSFGPPGSAEQVHGIRIPIWSTKSFLGRWFGPTSGEDLIEADLQLVGSDRIAGTMTNRLKQPLRNAILCFGDQVYYKLGIIPSGGTVRVELTPDRKLSGYLSDPAFRDSFAVSRMNQSSSRELSIDRGNLLRTMMFHDSDVSATNLTPSRAQHHLDLTGQLRLDRPMLVAEIADPGARIELENFAEPPEIEQVTLIRVILGLNKGEDAPRPNK